MSRDALLLADDLGPKGRRRVRYATALAALLLIVWVWVVLRRFATTGQLDGRKWDFVTDWRIWRFLLRGLRNTLTAALVAMAIALVLGLLGVAGRLHPARPVRLLAGALVELGRATPLVLLIYFLGQFIPRYGPDIGSYWYLVAGLAAYNGAVIAEIFRAGVRSLPRGQREAALTIGLSETQTIRLILLPQAIRAMLPALVNQLVTLLKDSSLGALVLLPAVDDLLHQGKIIGEFKKNPLQVLTVTAALYVVVNIALSQLAQALERRQRA